MLLRNMNNHIKSQNWTAVAIDFAIVVLGVFVAIQMSNWNDARLSNMQGSVFTERLRADLRFERLQFEIMNDYYLGVIANAENVIAALDGEAAMTDESFLIAAYRASQFTNFPRARATYEELKSTGTISLIEDRRLVLIATGLFDSSVDDVIIDSRNSDYRNAFQTIVPNEVQRALSRACGDRDEFDVDGLLVARDIAYKCSVDLPDETVSEVANALHKHPELIGQLRHRVATIESSLTSLQLIAEVIARTDP
jgi:hypothetical protein